MAYAGGQAKVELYEVQGGGHTWPTGWQYLPQIILLSACAGALMGTALILLRGRDSQIPIPFGPYLAAAGWISLMWGESINRAYIQWAGLA